MGRTHTHETGEKRREYVVQRSFTTAKSPSFRHSTLIDAPGPGEPCDTLGFPMYSVLVDIRAVDVIYMSHPGEASVYKTYLHDLVFHGRVALGVAVEAQTRRVHSQDLKGENNSTKQ